MIPLHPQAAKALQPVIELARRQNARKRFDPSAGQPVQHVFLVRGKLLSNAFLFDLSLKAACTTAGLADSSGRPMITAHRFRADARHLPLASSTLPAVITVMAHTDMPQYPDVLGEVARVLRPGGVFVHVGVHPCFCGGFADRSDPTAGIIRPGYLDSNWTTESWTGQGVRDKAGASHWPLPELVHAFLDAGLTPKRLFEGGTPVPTVLAIRARKN